MFTTVGGDRCTKVRAFRFYLEDRGDAWVSTTSVFMHGYERLQVAFMKNDRKGKAIHPPWAKPKMIAGGSAMKQYLRIGTKCKSLPWAQPEFGWYCKSIMGGGVPRDGLHGMLSPCTMWSN